MKSCIFLIGALLGAVSVHGAPLSTVWGEKVTDDNCWREYPRPQMVRSNWTCLNGSWDYAITSVTNTPGRPTKWDGRIRVPFAIESALSGVERLLEPDQFLWYTRKITCDPKPGRRLLLHFDGVDFLASVFIGHREVLDVPHAGASDPFTVDITDFVQKGDNELTVCVWDPTEKHVQSRGKQSLQPSGCYYTRVSGIWQTVWMEEVPELYIRSYRVIPDIDAGTVLFEFDKVEGAGEVTVTTDMPKDFELWSPENPKLYTFTARYGEDEIRGYYAMRKFTKQRDAKGVLRFFLNNRPYFVLGTLDQGWWPDGLLTPPSDEAMAFDIQTLRKCGFNTMRKHIKVEPLRYYYLCDKLGILVIQDMPSSNGWPTEAYVTGTMTRYGLYRAELKRMLDHLYNVPSIVMWMPFNEGWSQPGEFLTHTTLDFVSSYDPSRLVGGPSGWQDFEGGETFSTWRKPLPSAHRPQGVCEAGDTVDRHDYRGPSMFPVNDRRISFLGEFGGLGHPVEGHVWKTAKDSWGYGGIEDTRTPEGLEQVYLGLMDRLAVLAEQGLGGSIYTQTTDVEIEINGLLTYDRKVLKFNPEVLSSAHRKVLDAADRAAR